MPTIPPPVYRPQAAVQRQSTPKPIAIAAMERAVAINQRILRHGAPLAPATARVPTAAQQQPGVASLAARAMERASNVNRTFLQRGTTPAAIPNAAPYRPQAFGVQPKILAPAVVQPASSSGFGRGGSGGGYYRGDGGSSSRGGGYGRGGSGGGRGRRGGAPSRPATGASPPVPRTTAHAVSSGGSRGGSNGRGRGGASSPAAAAAAAASPVPATAPSAGRGGSERGGHGGRGGASAAAGGARQGAPQILHRIETYTATAAARPRILGSVVIGITDRGDIPRQIDEALVGFGTGCQVLVIRRPEDLAHVNALFIPGGMYDLPDTRGTALSQHAPRDQEAAEAWTTRVRLQQVVVEQARLQNLPVLGVCGGSRAIAQVVPGGYTAHLPDRGVHNQPFSEPWRSAHDVTIAGGTMLHRIAQGGPYRLPPGAATAAGAPLDVRVNSMHWAQSGFSHHSPVTLAASAGDGVLEGWELQGHPFFVGVQWHPEFAQLPLEDFTGREAPHAHIMGALGDAAEENRAAIILQAGIRGFHARRAARLERRDHEDTVPEWATETVPGEPGSFENGTFIP